MKTRCCPLSSPCAPVAAQTFTVTAQINGELFEWVIENLIKNALDAIETGTGKITIILSDRPGHVYIDVTDTGKGIDMPYRKEVFRPELSESPRRCWV